MQTAKTQRWRKSLRKFYVVAFLLLSLLLLGGLNKANACNGSVITLDSAKSIGGGKFKTVFTFCVGGGNNGVDLPGADNQTIDFYFNVFGSGVTICEQVAAGDDFYPDFLNSGQSASGCTNCRNACAFYGGLGNHYLDPTCTDLDGDGDTTCYGCGGPSGATHCPDTSSCPNGAGTCIWYSANDPCCNGGTAGSSCNTTGFNYFSFWGTPFNPASCPGQPNSTAGCRKWGYTDAWVGSGPPGSYCDTMYLVTTGLPDSIVGEGVENISGFGPPNCHDQEQDMIVDLSALPVSWSFIKAIPANENVAIHWGTNLELNNAFFLIKRSVDGKEFHSIGKVDGKNLRSGYEGYVYFDYHPQPGLSFYKITQYDQDGSSSESNTVFVDFDGQIQPHISSVFPTPAYEKATVSLISDKNQSFRVAVLNLQGKLMHDRQIEAVAGQNLVNIEISGYEAGIYIVRIENQANNLTAKILKI